MSEANFPTDKLPSWDIPHQLAKDHPELLHYTNKRGLSGIWEKQTIWATHFSTLSDTSELNMLREPLMALLVQKCRNFFAMKIHLDQELRDKMAGGRKIFDKIEARIESFINANYDALFKKNGMGMADPFFTSFCSHSKDDHYERDNGLLSQWRAYGDLSKFALVFDTASLNSLMKEEWQAELWTGLDLAPVSYLRDRETIREKFPDLIDNAFNCFITDLASDEYVQEFMLSFFKTASLLKHRGFHEEREVRIVAIPLKENVSNNQQSQNIFKKIRESDQGKKYIALFESLKKPLPITRIIVGPSKNQAVDEAFARDLTQGAVPITLSETPYIGP